MRSKPFLLKTCPICGRNYSTKLAGSKFCSRPCASEDLVNKKSGGTFTPPSKGAEVRYLLRTYFDIGGGRLPIGTFTFIGIRADVSREWVRQIAMKDGYTPYLVQAKAEKHHTCIQCGKDFVAPDNHRTKKYCSVDCRGAYFENKYKFKTNCFVCGKEINYFKVKQDRKPKYCSYECHGKSIHKGWHVAKDMTDTIDKLYGVTFTIKALSSPTGKAVNSCYQLVNRYRDLGIISQIGLPPKRGVAIHYKVIKK